MTDDEILKAADAIKQRQAEGWQEQQDNVNKRLDDCDTFQPEELIYAAFARCKCGAGLAYPRHIGGRGSWYCGSVLEGHSPWSSDHEAYSFMTYAIKSENQPSANGITTRVKT
jgi:hypothetical protein